MKDKIVFHMEVLFFWFLVGVYAPYELYISNVNEFWFSLKDFLGGIILISLIGILIFEIIIHILPKGTSEYLLFFVFYLGFITWVQGTFLNLDIGIMLSSIVQFKRYWVHFLVDAIVWFICFAVAFYIFFKKRELFKKISIIVSSFLFAVLFVTAFVLAVFSYKDETNKTNSTFFYSTENLTTFSNNDNIILFVLDMFDRDYLNTIIADQNEVLDKFDGFTVYDNYTGGFATTFASLSLINNGEFYLNNSSYEEFCNSIQKNQVDVLNDNGYTIENYGCSGFPKRQLDIFSNVKYGNKIVNNKKNFYSHIYEMGAFRYAPNIFKRWLIGFNDRLKNDYIIISDYQNYSSDNINIYNNICNSPLKIQYENDYKVIYANGTHYSYVNDENLNRVAANDDNTIECGIGVLKMVSAYIDKLKEAGVYDNTTIIITADHGYYHHDMDEFTQPILMIKEKSKHGKLKFNGAPVYQADIPATIVSIATGEDVNELGTSLFSINDTDERQRLYYHYDLEDYDQLTGNRRMIEYSIDTDSNKSDSYHLTGNEYTYNGNLINHEDYCKTCQARNKDKNGCYWHIKTDNYPEKSLVQ